MHMAAAVYLLCTFTSALCAFLLHRGYRQKGVRLLFWSAWCFWGLALNNAILYVDVVLMPNADLSIWRLLPAVAGMLFLLFGLIWEAE